MKNVEQRCLSSVIKYRKTISYASDAYSFFCFPPYLFIFFCFCAVLLAMIVKLCKNVRGTFLLQSDMHTHDG